jgi:hypothetical protein
MFVILMVSAFIWNITLILIGARLDTCHKEIIDELGIDGRLFCGFSIKQFVRLNEFIYKREFLQLKDKALNVLIGVYVFTFIIGMLDWLGGMFNLIKM